MSSWHLRSLASCALPLLCGVATGAAAQAPERSVTPRAISTTPTIHIRAARTVDEARVVAAVDPTAADLRRCTRLGDRIEVRFRLGPARRPERPSVRVLVRGARQRDDEACVRERVAEWRFPEEAGRGAVTLTFAFERPTLLAVLGTTGGGSDTLASVLSSAAVEEGRMAVTGDDRGSGGLDVIGVGRGGGGRGEGTIGLGRIGTGRAPSYSRVTLGAPSTSGAGLDPAALRAVLRRHASELRACAPAPTSPSGAERPVARAELRLVVGDDGTVLSSQVTGGTDGRPPSLDRCFALRARRWRFPARYGRAPITVVVPVSVAPPAR